MDDTVPVPTIQGSTGHDDDVVMDSPPDDEDRALSSSSFAAAAVTGTSGPHHEETNHSSPIKTPETNVPTNSRKARTPHSKAVAAATTTSTGGPKKRPRRSSSSLPSTGANHTGTTTSTTTTIPTKSAPVSAPPPPPTQPPEIYYPHLRSPRPPSLLVDSTIVERRQERWKQLLEDAEGDPVPPTELYGQPVPTKRHDACAACGKTGEQQGGNMILLCDGPT